MTTEAEKCVDPGLGFIEWISESAAGGGRKARKSRLFAKTLLNLYINPVTWVFT